MKTRLSALERFLLPRRGVPSRALRSLAIAAAFATVACLSPQDIEVEQVPVKAHLPPSFDVTKDVTPNTPVVCFSSLDTDPTEFRIDNIQDPSGQALEERWFMDYEDGYTSIQKDEQVTPDPGTTVAKPAVLSTQDLETVYRTIGHPFFLDVVISDGFAPNSVSPKNRAIAAGSFAVTYRWSVEYREGSPCPESP